MIGKTTMTLAAVAALSTQAQAQGVLTFPTVTYEVQPSSAHFAGCYFLCLCPIFYVGDVSGSMAFTQTLPAPVGFDTYAITDIDWQVTSLQGTVVMNVTGTGSYMVGGLTGFEHRMILDLVINGTPVDTYDTDLITMGGATTFPDIHVLIAQNDFACFEEPFELWLSPAIYNAYCDATTNSTGLSGVFSATGSRSLAANDLTLTARHVVPNEPGMFFFGPDAVALPFGNGTRCVGGTPTKRFPSVLWADDDGTFSLTIDNTILPDSVVWMVGETWNFQAVHRDPGTGAGFNMTDAGSIQFTP